MNNTDPFDRRIMARPRTLKASREAGVCIFTAHNEAIRRIKGLPVMIEWELEIVEKLGPQLGESLYRLGGTWTMNRFLNPIRNCIKSA